MKSIVQDKCKRCLGDLKYYLFNLFQWEKDIFVKYSGINVTRYRSVYASENFKYEKVKGGAFNHIKVNKHRRNNYNYILKQSVCTVCGKCVTYTHKDNSLFTKNSRWKCSH